jgi:hypothetical protein
VDFEKIAIRDKLRPLILKENAVKLLEPGGTENLRERAPAIKLQELTNLFK